jgi:hypothetical protein
MNGRARSRLSNRRRCVVFWTVIASITGVRETARDVVQEAFARGYAKRRQLREPEGQPHEGETTGLSQRIGIYPECSCRAIKLSGAAARGSGRRLSLSVGVKAPPSPPHVIPSDLKEETSRRDDGEKRRSVGDRRAKSLGDRQVRKGPERGAVGAQRAALVDDE